MASWIKAANVRLSIDAPDGKIEVGSTFHISIHAVNTPGEMEVDNYPPGVKVVYKSLSQQTINGETDTQLIWTCKGVTPGKYSFGPVSVGGKKSNKISYQVVPASGGSKPPSPSNNNNTNASVYDPNSGPLFVGKGNEEMFLKAYVNKTTAYEQEAIEYTVKLYTTYGDINFMGAVAAPKFEGFVVEESSDRSTSFVFEDYNGKSYKTAVIAKYIIFPQKAGRLKVIGNTYTVSTDARQYYHDPYYQTITVKRPVQLNVTPNDVIIDVKELPTPVPDNFMGGVGKFRLSSSMPTTHLTTNSAAQYIISIQGEGNIKYLKLPELAPYFPNSFELYTPEISVDAAVEEGTVKGTAKFDYSVVAKETGEFRIPSISFTYFDPDTEEYKTLKTDEKTVEVASGQVSSKSQQSLTFNNELLPIGKIKKHTDDLYVDSILYWLWYIVPFLLFVVSLGIYRKYINERSNMVIYRSKNANKMAMKRLAKAYDCIKNNQEEAFYDEMLSALWGYIADKLKIPTSQLNRSNVEEEFSKHNVKESTFLPIIKLIDECEYAKYTPVSRGANMRQIYSDAVESLSKVESEYEEETGKKSSEDDDNDEGSGGSDNYVNSTTQERSQSSSEIPNQNTEA